MQWEWVTQVPGKDIVVQDEGHDYYSLIQAASLGHGMNYFHQHLLDGAVVVQKRWYETSHNLSLAALQL